MSVTYIVHLPNHTSESIDTDTDSSPFRGRHSCQSSTCCPGYLQLHTESTLQPLPSPLSTDHAHLLVQLPPGAKEVTQYTRVLVTLSLQKGGRGSQTEQRVQLAELITERKAVSHW